MKLTHYLFVVYMIFILGVMFYPSQNLAQTWPSTITITYSHTTITCPYYVTYTSTFWTDYTTTTSFSTTTIITLLPHGWLAVHTDKSYYVPEENIRIEGDASNTPGVTWTYTYTNTSSTQGEGLEVKIEIFDPNNELIHVGFSDSREAEYKHYAYDYTLENDAMPGTYRILVTYGEPLSTLFLPGEGAFDVVTQDITTTTNGHVENRCIIATATYGSEMAPEVFYMRHVRDDMIGSNQVGEILVNGWNSFYYSWSPPLAQLIAEHNLLQPIFRVLLLPLVGTIHMTALIHSASMFISSTFASVVAFLFAAIISTATYIMMPILGLRKLFKKN